MALTDSFPGAPGVADSADLRKGLAGLIVRDTVGNPRAGIFPRHTNALVTSRADMMLDVAAFEGASVRGGGPLFMSNDGVAQSPVLDAAPASNSRIDVLYFKQNESVPPYADANNLPVFGVAIGTSAASPTKPSVAGIAGAVELATITIPSTATATSSAGVVITNTYQYTTTTGGVLLFRTANDRDLYTTATPGQHVFVLADGAEYTRAGSTWARFGTSPWVTYSPTLTNLVIGTGGAALTFAEWRYEGDLVHVNFAYIIGTSGQAVGTIPTMTLPVPAAPFRTPTKYMGIMTLYDVSAVATWEGRISAISGSTTAARLLAAPGTGVAAPITATAPFAWDSGDHLVGEFTYKPAS